MTAGKGSWRLRQTDDERPDALVQAALTATHRDDLPHGTNAAYVRRCVRKLTI
jgi:hypothetical protein